MQFHVPQFIEVENKIFGPLTFKQFAYVIGGAGLIFLLYAFLPFWLVLILGTQTGAFTLGLAFVQIHGKPFIKVIENSLRYFSGARLYLWKKPSDAKKKKKKLEIIKQPSYVPKLTESKLQDLAWSLDVKEKIK